MARFNLNKGEKFNLSKESELDKIRIDLNWKSGADLDASAFLLNADDTITEDADFVFYNSDNRTEPYSREKFGSKKNWRASTVPMSYDGSVIGSADDLGDEEEGEYSGETMHVNLSKVRSGVDRILFVVTIHDTTGSTTFRDVAEASITIINEDTDEELCRYQLNENFQTETAVEVAALVLNEDGEWEFEAIGKGYDGGLQTLVEIYAE